MHPINLDTAVRWALDTDCISALPAHGSKRSLLGGQPSFIPDVLPGLHSSGQICSSNIRQNNGCEDPAECSAAGGTLGQPPARPPAGRRIVQRHFSQRVLRYGSQCPAYASSLSSRRRISCQIARMNCAAYHTFAFSATYLLPFSPVSLPGQSPVIFLRSFLHLVLSQLASGVCVCVEMASRGMCLTRRAVMAYPDVDAASRSRGEFCFSLPLP